MSSGPSIMRRLLAKICPEFIEDWAGAAGDRFRRGVAVISEYNSKHVRVSDRIEAAPDMLWRAAEGATSAQHAKAQADYAKAENDRIDAELRRRTLDAKARHECADADKAEAEARIARIKEMQVRLELVLQLNAAGVSLTYGEQMELTLQHAAPKPEPQLADVFTTAELRSIESELISVNSPDAGETAIDFSFCGFSVSLGSRVERGDTICELRTVTSPPTTLPVSSPSDGMIVRLYRPLENAALKPNTPLAIVLVLR